MRALFVVENCLEGDLGQGVGKEALCESEVRFRSPPLLRLVAFLLLQTWLPRLKGFEHRTTRSACSGRTSVQRSCCSGSTGNSWRVSVSACGPSGWSGQQMLSCTLCMSTACGPCETGDALAAATAWRRPSHIRHTCDSSCG